MAEIIATLAPFKTGHSNHYTGRLLGRERQLPGTWLDRQRGRLLAVMSHPQNQHLTPVGHRARRLAV